MSKGSRIWYGQANEDGSCTLLARITSLDATGEEYLPGEGPVVLQDDVSTITCKVYDLGTDKDALTGTEVTPAPTVVVATNIFDTLRRSGWPLPPEGDTIGYNFRFDVGAAYLPNPNTWYAIEFLFTLVGGGVFPAKFRVYTNPFIQS